MGKGASQKWLCCLFIIIIIYTNVLQGFEGLNSHRKLYVLWKKYQVNIQNVWKRQQASNFQSTVVHPMFTSSLERLKTTSENSSFACPKPLASAKRTQRRQLHWQRILSPATVAQGHRVPNSPPIDMDIHMETRKAPQNQRFPSHVAQLMKDSPFLLGQALQLHIKQIRLVSISHSPEKHSPSLTQTTTLEFP